MYRGLNVSVPLVSNGAVIGFPLISLLFAIQEA